jgi:uncharacterized protein YdaT
MPWNSGYFPASMRNLSEAVRCKAIEIANALLAQGMDEGKAIRIAIAKSRQWALHQGLRVREDDRDPSPSGHGFTPMTVD